MDFIKDMNANDWSNLMALAGVDFNGQFFDAYLPYDSPKQHFDGFESAHALGRRVLAWAEMTYTGDGTPVASDLEFVQLVKAGTPPYMKNFMRESDEGSFFGNNCGKNYKGKDKKTLRCKYGDIGKVPAKVLTIDDELVKDCLLFSDGTESNLMSYIAPFTGDGVRRKIHLTERQRDIVRLSTRIPSRLRLRNYALFE